MVWQTPNSHVTNQGCLNSWGRTRSAALERLIQTHNHLSQLVTHKAAKPKIPNSNNVDITQLLQSPRRSVSDMCHRSASVGMTARYFHLQHPDFDGTIRFFRIQIDVGIGKYPYFWVLYPTVSVQILSRKTGTILGQDWIGFGSQSIEILLGSWRDYCLKDWGTWGTRDRSSVPGTEDRYLPVCIQFWPIHSEKTPNVSEILGILEGLLFHDI
jgi:hypothetical protein